MPRFAANLWFLFQEMDMLDRFAAAADAGFKGVEMQFPYGWPADAMAKRLADNELQQVLINAPPGNREKGERGLAGLVGREREFRDSIAAAIDYAKALTCPAVHVMAGVPDAKIPRQKSVDVFCDNLLFAADACGRHGIRVTIEPINRLDVPGYLIGTTAEALAVLARVGHDNLFLQYDLYHGTVTGDDLAETVRDNVGVIAHMQVASPVGRHEPEGDDFTRLFQAIDAAGYGGWIGCEYKPRAGTLAGLGWARAYGIGNS